MFHGESVQREDMTAASREERMIRNGAQRVIGWPASKLLQRAQSDPHGPGSVWLLVLAAGSKDHQRGVAGVGGGCAASSFKRSVAS